MIQKRVRPRGRGGSWGWTTVIQPESAIIYGTPLRLRTQYLALSSQRIPKVRRLVDIAERIPKALGAAMNLKGAANPFEDGVSTARHATGQLP